MRTLLKGVLGVGLLVTIAARLTTPRDSVVVAQELKDEISDDPVASDMKRKALALKGVGREKGQETRLDLLDRNLLSSQDRARGVPAGSLWIWGKTGRPAAILSLYYYGKFPAAVELPRRWHYEMTALTSKIASVQGDSWVWTPDAPTLAFRPVPDAPAPLTNAERRLRQIQLLAHQFAAVQNQSTGKQYFLPLYPDVLHRYDDAPQGIIDGALFVFVHETNPEVLMLLECQKDAAGLWGWHVAFAPLAANEFRIYHVDDEVYHGPPQRGLTNTTPYTTQHTIEQ